MFQRLLMLFAGVKVKTLDGLEDHLPALLAQGAETREFVSGGIFLQLLVQCGHEIAPHLFGDVNSDTLLVGDMADNGLVARHSGGESHCAACGVVGAGGGIVMRAHIAAGQRTHARKLYHIALLDEFYDKFCYIHNLGCFFLLHCHCVGCGTDIFCGLLQVGGGIDTDIGGIGLADADCIAVFKPS